MTVLALIGAKSLYLLWIWLASAIIASQLSARKGYGEKPGLATGLLTSAVGILVWLLWPARKDSRWKTEGPIPRRRKTPAADTVAARVEAGKGPGVPGHGDRS